MWLKIRQEGQTAGFGPCFHLPIGFHFGTGFLSHGQIRTTPPPQCASAALARSGASHRCARTPAMRANAGPVDVLRQGRLCQLVVFGCVWLFFVVCSCLGCCWLFLLRKSRARGPKSRPKLHLGLPGETRIFRSIGVIVMWPCRIMPMGSAALCPTAGAGSDEQASHPRKGPEEKRTGAIYACAQAFVSKILQGFFLLQRIVVLEIDITTLSTDPKVRRLYVPLWQVSEPNLRHLRPCWVNFVIASGSVYFGGGPVLGQPPLP